METQRLPLVPIDRAEQDAQQHAWQEALELHMKGGEEDGAQDDTRPGGFAKPDQDGLQGAAETSLFTDRGKHGDNEYVEQDACRRSLF